jgi:hypothetical protein
MPHFTQLCHDCSKQGEAETFRITEILDFESTSRNMFEGQKLQAAMRLLQVQCYETKAVII